MNGSNVPSEENVFEIFTLAKAMRREPICHEIFFTKARRVILHVQWCVNACQCAACTSEGLEIRVMHLVLMDLGDLEAGRQLVTHRIEEPARRPGKRHRLPDADVPPAAGLADAAAQRTADHLVAEADAEDPLAHAVEVPDQAAQPQDPQVVAVRVVRAAADHEAIVPLEVVLAGQLPVHCPVQVPRLAGVAERGHEDVEAAVLLQHVLPVVRRHQQRVPPTRPDRCPDNHGRADPCSKRQRGIKLL
uniref:Uncharacterized protein n=1 Tax=Arundo donax TaxID=35708 RepID=A0A0A9AS14_ARUDO